MGLLVGSGLAGGCAWAQVSTAVVQGWTSGLYTECVALLPTVLGVMGLGLVLSLVFWAFERVTHSGGGRGD